MRRVDNSQIHESLRMIAASRKLLRATEQQAKPVMQDQARSSSHARDHTGFLPVGRG